MQAPRIELARKRLDTEVQKLTDDTIKDIDAAAHAKEQEILGK